MTLSADNFAFFVRKVGKEIIANETLKTLQGTWIAAEAEDADLSHVVIEGIEVRWVRKSAHVTGLVAGNQVLCLHGPALPVTIIAKIVGDISLANAGD